MITTRYYLPEDMYMCPVDDQLVILDLRRDKYLALDGNTSTLLRPHVDLLTSQGVLLQSGHEDILREALSRLSASGILCTTQSSPPGAATRRPLSRPEAEITPRPPLRERVRTHHALQYISSVLSAKLVLGTRPLHRIVLTEHRKSIARAPSCRVFDEESAARLCAVYSRLRVIATGPKQCLFDSLALKLFLAAYGVFPDWIFGVRLNPFAAHCWLQHGDTVVNDSLDSVRRFSPIMAV
jgi:hypothetical protein